MKKVLGVLGAIVAAVALLIAIAVGRQAGRSAIDQYESGRRSAALTKALAAANQGLPKMIDPETRIDRVSAAPNRVFIYDYTLVNYPLPGQNPFDIFDSLDTYKALAIKQACAIASVKKMLSDGYTITYRYADKNGRELFDVQITRAQCYP